MMKMDLKPGQMYEIVHKNPLQKINRRSVMLYLGRNHVLDTHSFSARPVAGTQDLDESIIISIKPVARDSAVVLNRLER